MIGLCTRGTLETWGLVGLFVGLLVGLIVGGLLGYWAPRPADGA